MPEKNQPEKPRARVLDHCGNMVATVTQQGYLKIFEGERADEGIYIPAAALVLPKEQAKNLHEFLDECQPREAPSKREERLEIALETIRDLVLAEYPAGDDPPRAYSQDYVMAQQILHEIRGALNGPQEDETQELPAT